MSVQQGQNFPAQPLAFRRRRRTYIFRHEQLRSKAARNFLNEKNEFCFRYAEGDSMSSNLSRRTFGKRVGAAAAASSVVPAALVSTANKIQAQGRPQSENGSLRQRASGLAPCPKGTKRDGTSEFSISLVCRRLDACTGHLRPR